jgi:hypothetical protein
MSLQAGFKFLYWAVGDVIEVLAVTRDNGASKFFSPPT